MRIRSITLTNYRLYRGSNSIFFQEKEGHNIYLISGENGFGKTTFLHSLLWCLYGRLMTDIDDTVRKEIANKGGYNTFLKSNLNILARQNVENLPQNVIGKIKKVGYSFDNEKIKSDSVYSVTIDFADVFIPSIPCDSLRIMRSYDFITDKETVEIYIDGKLNELSKEIGSEVFINDFILNKDIARFFFFDSERIVALADTNTLEEKRKLNSAYNEVLGVKKYEDLKRNLENLRLRFRRKSDDIVGKNKLIVLIDQQDALKDSISQMEDTLIGLDQRLTSLNSENERLQVELLREGNNITIDELRRQEAIVKTTKEKDTEYKAKLKQFLEYAPFAIAGGLLSKTKEQVERDRQSSLAKSNVLNQNALLLQISLDLNEVIDSFDGAGLWAMQFKQQVDGILSKYVGVESSDEQLLSLSDAEYKEFIAVYTNVTTTYKAEFAHLADDYKKNKQILERASRRIANMQSNENDSVIKSIRAKKNEVEKQLSEVETQIRKLVENKAFASRDLATIGKQITELSKTVSLDDSDVKKDNVAEALISELDAFLASLKQEKKTSLEMRIRTSMNALMHKENFIGSVRVNISDEAMDIDLLSPFGEAIRKDSLSKGEQQLYATSLLKALVDESRLSFPVFIDSPLQKFDKSHSNKIITEFYPAISKQVVLFPLLHKELTESELELMKPLVNATYLIKNDTEHSFIEQIPIESLMKE